MEAKLQSEIIKWLKSQGAYVIKTKPGMGTPVGCPDVVALFEGAWLVIEVKSRVNAPWSTGQEATFNRLAEWCPFVYRAYPENWPEIKAQLQSIFF